MKENKLHNDNLEQRLQEAAENLEMQPSAEVWKNIQSNISSGSKKVYWLRWAALAAAVLLLAGLGWYFLNTSGGQTEGIQNSLVYVDSSSGTHLSGDKENIPTNKTGSKTNNELAKGQSKTLPQKGISDSASSEVLAANTGSNTKTSLSSGATLSKKSNGKKETSVPSESTIQKKNFKSGTGQDIPDLATNSISEEKIQSKEKNHVEANRNVKISYLPSRIPSKALTLLDGSTAQVHYSDKMAQLMLQSAGAAPLLAKNDGSGTGSKMKIGVFFTPGMSYRTLKAGASPPGRENMNTVNSMVSNNLGSSQVQSPTMRLNVENMPLQQRQSWGWSSGARIAWSLPKNWILQTGLSLRQVGYEITAYKQESAYLFNNNTSSLGSTLPENSTYTRYANGAYPNEQKTTLENTYLSTELPLLIGHRFGGHPDKISFTVLGGAGLTYLLHADATIYEPHSERYFSDNDYLSKFNSSLILEANMDIPISKALGFSIGPALQYQIFSSYKNYKQVQEYPYLVGVKTALYLK